MYAMKKTASNPCRLYEAVFEFRNLQFNTDHVTLPEQSQSLPWCDLHHQDVDL